MANLGFVFDSSTVEPSSARETLPPGDYVVHIVDSGMKPTSKGGQMLVLTMEVLDGQHQGARLFERLNLDNPSQQAVEIAQRTLSAICRATGQVTVSDSDELHFKPMVVSVKVDAPKPRPYKDGEQAEYDGNGHLVQKFYPPQNSISGYKPHIRSTPAAPRPRPVAAPVAVHAAPAAPAPAQAAVPAWRRAAAG